MVEAPTPAAAFVPAPITKRKILAVEGKDEVNFFVALLALMGIGDCDIRYVAGKDYFPVKLRTLTKDPGFGDVETFAVIRDADEDASAAFNSIKKVLEERGLVSPKTKNTFGKGCPKVGIFILPGNSDKGMLEDLCLRTVKDRPAMACVDKFAECAMALRPPPKIPAKAKAQAFLAAMPEIVNSVGLGAQKGYWDFHSGELADLKSFLENLR